MRCVYCAIGRLRPIGPIRPSRLTVTFTFCGRSYPLADPAGLVCDRCGEALISQHAAAALRMAALMMAALMTADRT
jgi:hypothetical protein